MNPFIPLNYFLITAAIMFFAGFYGFFSRKNMVSRLISLVLMLNAVLIIFAAFNRHVSPHKSEGILSVLMVIAVILCETAVAVTVIIRLKGHNDNPDKRKDR